MDRDETTAKYIRPFAGPDEVIEMDRLRSEMVTLGGLTVSHDVHQPGWRWSTDVKPVVGTEWCMLRHVGVVLSGRMGILLSDGTEFDVGPMSVVDIPAVHDAWVVGGEPLEMISWTGVRGWISPLESLRERVLTTIVFTDIVDSTGTAIRMGPTAWADLVTSHETRMREQLGRFRGVEIRMTGDGVLAVCDGAARAIRCARALIAVAGDLGLGLRAAVHTGEVEFADEDLRGVAVHEASRILGLARDGEVLISATTAALVGDAGFVLEDRGEHELRGLDGLRRLFSVG
ncbi:MAG: adenylate/guanylate cyclase domain-containing protein [Acidimicrobiia bacterium]